VTATSAPSGLDGSCRCTVILPHVQHRLAVTSAADSLPTGRAGGVTGRGLDL
jgi:hypothetical protein